MAGAKFDKLPNNTEAVTRAGKDITIVTETVGREDGNGTIQAGPAWQAFTITAPVGEGGAMPLAQIATLAASEGWKTTLDEESQWVTAVFTLDRSNGWGISYQCKRILIDGW